ncbi:hypothetical protein [Paenibacillus durus]|uniref:Lipoprotein n=1 Tax=Paenibacillus durus ATCC 35681 TaxID=1333534 RepID=A0A0F7FBS3_PAEDU|nr:hypothetical protein [Paenibacillus durus]AKG36167.1 hypothetical protein VK70_17685 [Paenibacillus durus ATCC 35681]
MKTKIILFLLGLVILTSCAAHGNQQIRVRTPTEQELERFLSTEGVKALTVKNYKDHTIILGDHSVYTLSITADNEFQYVGSSWSGGPDRIVVTAVSHETPFIGVIIHRSDVLEQGNKMKITFEDGNSVEKIMHHEKAYIVDHPLGKRTNSSKAIVEVFNEKGEMIYRNN